MWRDLVVLFSHVATYLSSLARTGEPPTATADGEPFAPPYQGIFRSVHEAKSELYKEWKYAGMFLGMARFAVGVGETQKGVSWACEGMTLARKAGHKLTSSFLVSLALPHLVEESHFEEALSSTVEMFAVLTAARQLESDGKFAVEKDVDPMTILGPKPNPAWQDAERSASFVVVVPAVFRVAAVFLDSATEGRKLAHELANACRSTADEASDSAYWLSIARLLNDLLADFCELKAAEKLAQEYDDESTRTRFFICQFAPAIQEKLPLEQIAATHLRWVQLIEESLPRGSGLDLLFTQLVAPYVSDFWGPAFRRERFRFSSPSMVEEELAHVKALAEPERMRATLRIIASGLGLRLPSDLTDWLRK